MAEVRNRTRKNKGGVEAMVSPAGESTSSFSPLQSHFLQRLNRLLRLRGEQATDLNEDGLLLIDRAIYSTYCDAVDLGVAVEAQELLHSAGVAAGSAAQQ
jgi:hypothetical protein